MKNYYDILGVANDASPDEIKRAFRKLARESHPDANPDDPTAEERFREVAEAYEVLSDPDKRARYDRGDTVDFSNLFGGSLDDLLRSVFGESGLFGDSGLFGSAGRTARRRGRDVLVAAELTLEEAFAGVTKDVSFSGLRACETCHGRGAAGGSHPETCGVCQGNGVVRTARASVFGQVMQVVECTNCTGTGQVIAEPCGTCQGLGATRGQRTLTVDVPAGVDSGTRLRLSGSGESGGRSGTPGDLYVEVHVKPDDRFVRDGTTLLHRVDVGIAEAALGKTVEVPLIDGGSEEVELPAGTQPNTRVRMAGLGMPRVGRRGRGDLIVEVSVVVPTRLTKEQEAALRSYAELAGDEPGGRRRMFR